MKIKLWLSDYGRECLSALATGKQMPLSDSKYSYVLSVDIPPHMIFAPDMSLDGNKWSALFGANIQEGVVGFGDSPAEAIDEFDREWLKQLAPGFKGHKSDCAVHNEPALPAGPCDCGFARESEVSK